MSRLVAALCLSTTLSGAQGPVVAITHATVIDGTNAPPRTDTTIIVTGRRITAIGPSRSLRAPAGAEIVDGTGMFVIPGLYDMHVHLGGVEDGRRRLQQMLRYGVVGVRDMASPMDAMTALKKEAAAAPDTLPQVVAAGPILQNKLPFEVPPMIRMVANASEAKQAVEDLKANGADFIKVGDTLSSGAYFAIAAESRRLRLPFAGHQPVSVSAAEASRAGQRSIEHFGSATFQGVLIGCSTDEAALTKYVQDALAAGMAGGQPPDARLFKAAFTTRLVNTYSAAKCAQLFALFARNGTWQVPTLVAINEVWNGKQTELSTEDKQAGERVKARYAEMLRGLHTAGVRLLAGSDSVGEPGGGLHDELQLLVKAGLSPLSALQAATRNAADFLGTLRTNGTISVGKAANLVMLTANPLDDISNTRRISVVVLAGRVIRR